MYIYIYIYRAVAQWGQERGAYATECADRIKADLKGGADRIRTADGIASAHPVQIERQVRTESLVRTELPRCT